jgi:hypothetical protein
VVELRGDWSSSVTYEFGDVVSYQGSAYSALVANANITPGSNASIWMLWGSKGDPGDPGPAGATGSPGAAGVAGATGPQGPPGAAGAAGAAGPAGSAGAAGAPGSILRNGNGAPSNSLGIDGDYYLDDVMGDVYHKVSGSYGVVANVKGPQGPNGSGAPGSTWRNGSGAPSQRPGDRRRLLPRYRHRERPYQGQRCLFGHGQHQRPDRCHRSNWATGATGAGATGATGATGQGVPTGGTANQVLSKIDSTNFNTHWSTPSGGGSLPPGGTTDQVLQKLSGTDGDADWRTVAAARSVFGGKVFDIRDHGAIEGPGHDNATAIQAALDAGVDAASLTTGAGNNTPVGVFVPSGDWYVSSPVFMDVDRVTLFGPPAGNAPPAQIVTPSTNFPP